MSLGIKKGDKVAIIAGKDRGKTGRVLKVVAPEFRVIVEGVNLVKKHMRRRSESEQGGIKEIPLPLHVSNVALFCGQCNKGVRFKVSILENKNKIRICKKCQQPI